MKKVFNSLIAIAVVTAVIFFISCKKNGSYGGKPPNRPGNVNAVVKSAAGDGSAIVTKLDEFRALAVDPLNVAPGAISGRREVKWDSVPGAFTNSNNFPSDFF